jgi:protein-tyrosine kinase
MSRIHDALKRAELQKGTAEVHGASTGPKGFEIPIGTLQEEWQREGDRQATDWPRLGSGPESREAMIATLAQKCARYTWSSNPKAVIALDDAKNGFGAEELRSLRSRLYLARNGRQIRKLLVTSALPKEGKSFTAGNLAQVFASQAELRVLLIDADMRLPTLHTVFGAPQIPGLSEYLSGKSDEISVIQRGQRDNLFFIPSGSHLPNASELIGTGRMKVLLDHVSTAFDWVVIDSPPILPVSDAKLLADICDGVLVVIKMGSTPYDLAQRACNEFAKGKVLGIVMNRVEPKCGYNSYYYRQ